MLVLEGTVLVREELQYISSGEVLCTENAVTMTN